MRTESGKKFIIKVDSPAAAADLLSLRTGLSKSRTKASMNKGACWIKRGSRMKRLRKATAMLKTGEHLEFYYDESLLDITPALPSLVDDRQHYSVWFKPAGLMAQGTMYGDHCSMLRQAELHFGSKREVFLVHRLDREASGLMIVGHTKEAASKLSVMFKENKVVRTYSVEVLGDIRQHGAKGRIEFPLDSKDAVTGYEFVSYDPASNSSALDVRIYTGRLHQIRRHLDMIGFPVIGDPKYGKGNKNKEGMRLVASCLEFICPFSEKEVLFRAASA
ncbi:MAG: RluA family pseudouridine synthase [Dissulfurispiraceae bacterium]|jgi:tRNA pseudouridine32 synthase/23S rRNA pseudouridine746 synthase|nr:RluA family pseudouridine synthase [Dissulfurispiraceae bacterium]